MAKKLADKWDDTVRAGKEIGYRPEPEDGMLYGVFIRKFDSERLEMSPWVLVDVLHKSEPAARGIWDETVSQTKSGAVMCGVMICVNKVWAPGELKLSPDKYASRATAIEVRASHLLRDGKQSGKDQVPDGSGLADAIDSEVDRYMRSTDQSGDDAAKDNGHATANGTPDPTPENTAVDHQGEPIPVATMEPPPDGMTCHEFMTGNPDPVEPQNNTRGKGKGKVKVVKP